MCGDVWSVWWTDGACRDVCVGMGDVCTLEYVLGVLKVIAHMRFHSS